MATIVRFPLRARPLATPGSSTSLADSRDGDRDLLPIGVVLWLASVARVALALAEREVFGVESTLALLCVLSLPCLLHRGPRVDAASSAASPHRADRTERRGVLIVLPRSFGAAPRADTPEVDA